MRPRGPRTAAFLDSRAPCWPGQACGHEPGNRGSLETWAPEPCPHSALSALGTKPVTLPRSRACRGLSSCPVGTHCGQAREPRGTGPDATRRPDGSEGRGAGCGQGRRAPKALGAPAPTRLLAKFSESRAACGSEFGASVLRLAACDSKGSTYFTGRKPGEPVCGRVL